MKKVIMMKMFMVKAFLAAALMFISVLFGMQHANEGTRAMRGYDEKGLNPAFSINESSTGELEASILGQDVSSHDLEKKREKLEKMKAYNFFSSAGRDLAEGLSKAADTAIQKVADLIK